MKSYGLNYYLMYIALIRIGYCYEYLDTLNYKQIHDLFEINKEVIYEKYKKA